MHDLALRLLAIEAKQVSAANPHAPVAGHVCDKFRVSLSRFAGIAGYSALITRAVALAKVQAPSLGPLQVRADGSLAGFEGIELRAAAVLIDQLFALLVTFIGESMALTLVRDAWPHESFEMIKNGVHHE